MGLNIVRYLPFSYKLQQNVGFFCYGVLRRFTYHIIFFYIRIDTLPITLGVKHHKCRPEQCISCISYFTQASEVSSKERKVNSTNEGNGKGLYTVLFNYIIINLVA